MKQFNGANVTPKDDAVLYNFFDPRNGIITGCEVSFLGDNQIKINGGYGLIGGRLFLVEEEVLNIPLSAGGTVLGRTIIKVDLGDSVNPISFVNQTGTTLPDLTQENISVSGTVYELPVATYYVEATKLSNFEDARYVIYPDSKSSKYEKSGIIKETLIDGFDYTFKNVTSLTLTASAGHSHGMIFFADSITEINVNVTKSLGDKIDEAEPGEVWEFDIENGYAFFANWGDAE